MRLNIGYAPIVTSAVAPIHANRALSAVGVAVSDTTASETARATHTPITGATDRAWMPDIATKPIALYPASAGIRRSRAGLERTTREAKSGRAEAAQHTAAHTPRTHSGMFAASTAHFGPSSG